MKLLKKTFAIMLSLILVVGMIPGSLMTAHAAGTGGGFTAAASSLDGWDLHIDKDGKLTWNSKGDTGKYTIHVDLTVAGNIVFNVSDVSATSFDLKAEFENRKIESGSYCVWVATQNSGFPINSGTILTNYVSGQPKLAEPKNLKYVATEQSWDSVPGATGYIFTLYDAKGTVKARNNTSNTSVGHYVEDGYWFTVQATADGYRNSNVAESPKYGTGTSGGFTAAASSLDGWDLHIDKDGKLTWNSKGDTGKYTIHVDLTVAGNIVFNVSDVSATSFDLKAEFENRKIESGSYCVWVATQNSGFPINSGTILTNYVSGQPKLAEPKNLKYVATEQSWDSVPGATGYIFTLYDAKGTVKARNNTSNTSVGHYVEDGYWFTVQATADGYRNSNVAESPKYGEVVTPPDDTKIKEISITGLQAPVAGTASGTITATFTPNDKFDVFYSNWLDESSANFYGNFVEGEDYQAFFALDAKDGEAFDSSVTVTTDKGTVTATTVDEQGSNCYIWVKLTAVGTVTPPDDTKIKEISITGLQEPVAGTAPGTPSVTFTPNDKFDVTSCVWLDKSSAPLSENFVEGEDYQVLFVLEAKDGEAFDSSVTVTTDKGTVTYTTVEGSNCYIWVKLTAVGTVTPPTEYDITVTGGTASANKAVAGTSITLTAEQIDGKVFSHWEVNGATVSDANAKETTFTMGNADVTAEAIYDDCECKCHKGGIVGFFYKIVLFFQKLFGMNTVCGCQMKHNVFGDLW